MPDRKYVIGLDYGTDSVRSLVVDTATGEELGTAVYEYPRWRKGLYCDPVINKFRQHPADYLDGLKVTVKEALVRSPPGTAEAVVGISVDTTGSTPVAVDRAGTPLSLRPEFTDNPNAMFVLWKDHTSIREAEEINECSRSWGGEDFTKYCGGIYSSEWFWAKILHILREDAAVKEAAFSWVEHCDWMPAVLTGTTDPTTMVRSRCAAGHKAMWNEAFDGLPAQEFLSRLDPLLDGIRERLYVDTCPADTAVGTLTDEWAGELGLTADVVVGSGAIDAHMGAVGGGVGPYILTKIMGTSTCDMLVVPQEVMGEKLVRGICGQVDGSIVPGMIGLEAGQSGFGDFYAWFKELLYWPIETLGNGLARETKNAIWAGILPALNHAAAEIAVGESGVLALDWINGRRTPDANEALKAAISGLSMGCDAPRVYRALVEATAFGSKKITDRLRAEGVEINGVVALGGIAKKSPLVMQVVADVLNMPIRVVRSQQTCALGAAMFAAVVAGVHGDVIEAQKAMESGFEAEYRPVAEHVAKYRRFYERYCALGHFVESMTGR